MTDLKKAKQILEDGGFTCVLVKGEQTYSSKERGVAPLLKFLDETGEMSGFSAADKVVGKAAAFLYVLLAVEQLYVKVISKSALEVLNQHDISVEYEELVEAIRNRANTGFCPMETAVREINEPQKAWKVILEKRKELSH